MNSAPITYQQLDRVLHALGFSRTKLEPKWVKYSHTLSDTDIILVEKKPTENVRESDAWSAREHLVRKGLVGSKDLERMLVSHGN